MTPHNAEQVSNVIDYLDYFGLQEDPFSPELLPFYDGGSRRELLAELLHLSQFSPSILTVLGETGVGKASLKAALAEHFAERDVFCEIAIPALSSSDALLRELAHQLRVEIDPANPTEAIALLRLSVQQEEEDILKVIAIENAQNLDADSLKFLLRLTVEADASPYRQFHLLLFATPEFENRLQEIDDQSLLQIFQLQPIAAKDMKHYLRFRLDAVGFSGLFPFKDSDIQFLWDISKGVPGKFHDAAREILIEAATPAPEPKTIGLPATHMAAIVLLLAGLLLVFFYNRDSVDDETEVVALASETVPPESPVQAPTLNTQPNNTPQADTPAPIEADEKPVSDDAAIVAAVESPPVSNLSTEKVPTPTQTAPVQNLADANTDQNNNYDPEAEVKAILAAAQKELGSGPTNAPKPRATTSPAKQQTPPASVTSDENQLLERSPTNYTLQILASGSRDAVDDFLQRQPNRKDLALFTTQRQGKTLYIVVMGNFPDSDSARLAVRQLPQEQRQAGPWPRTLQSVQAEIREFRGF